MVAPGAAAPRKPLTAALIQDLSARIAGATLRPGDRLPTERELMGVFGVSRTVVREAISSLRAEGLVVTHQGKGAFVAREGGRAAFRLTEADVTTLQDVVRVMEVRIGLEAEAAALAARRRTEAQLDQLRAAFGALEASGESSEAALDVEADLRFHRLIAGATGNGYFVDLFRQFGPLLIPRARVDTFRHDPAGRSAYLRRVNQEHEQVLRAIASGDADAARAAMRVHLVNGRERIRAAFEQVSATA